MPLGAVACQDGIRLFAANPVDFHGEVQWAVR